MKEQKLKQPFIRRLRTEKCHVQPIEVITGLGVPDVNICRDGYDLWIEFKRYGDKAYPHPLVRPNQRAWMLHRVRAGGLVTVVAFHVEGGFFRIYDVGHLLSGHMCTYPRVGRKPYISPSSYSYEAYLPGAHNLFETLLAHCSQSGL